VLEGPRNITEDRPRDENISEVAVVWIGTGFLFLLAGTILNAHTEPDLIKVPA